MRKIGFWNRTTGIGSPHRLLTIEHNMENRAHHSKNLVLCFDGTGNNFQSTPITSVLKLFKMLKKNSNEQQLCYYQPGIGSVMIAEDNRARSGEVLKRFRYSALGTFDSMVAYTMDEHVIEAYKYLIKYYNEGDKIYLFGFSRGAFTARILAGMMESVGLLNRGLEAMASTAWQIHKNWEFDGQPSSEGKNKHSNHVAFEFKRVFSRGDVLIEFMGLWDSVNSIGLIRDRMFPFTARSNVVKHIRHAVSLDERRGKFKQKLFTTNCYFPSLFSLDSYFEDDDSSEIIEEESIGRGGRGEEYEETNTLLSAHRFNDSEEIEVTTDLIELWFCGAHGDIGGGYSDDSKGQNLSNIPFRWVLASAIEFGIILKENAISEYTDKYTSADSLMSCHHDPLCVFKDRPLDDQASIAHHSLERNHGSDLFPQPINIQRPIAPIAKGNDCRGDDPFIMPILWWIGELLPLDIFIENAKGRWRSVYVPNLGRPRKLPRRCYQLHWSIFWRMHYVLDYRPHNLPNRVRTLWDLLNSRNQVAMPDERVDNGHNGDDTVVVVIKNKELVDYKTGALRLDIIDRYPIDRIYFDINWDDVPDDLNNTLTALN